MAISPTFIALILKKDKSLSFHEFRAISLCNLLYKIIANIIATRLIFFIECISYEHFVFLNERQIHDALGVPRAGLQSIKLRNFQL